MFIPIIEVISHDPSEMSLVLMVQNGRKCITYVYYIIKQLFTYVSMGRYTLEQIHNTKEQMYLYETEENHKAKERLFESFK